MPYILLLYFTHYGNIFDLMSLIADIENFSCGPLHISILRSQYNRHFCHILTSVFSLQIRSHFTNCTLGVTSYSDVTISNCKPFQNPVTLAAADSTDHSLSVFWEEPEVKSVKNLFIEWMDISVSLLLRRLSQNDKELW